MPIRLPENTIEISESINAGMMPSVDGRDIPLTSVRSQINFVNKENGIFSRLGLINSTYTISDTSSYSDPQLIVPFYNVAVPEFALIIHAPRKVMVARGGTGLSAMTGSAFAAGATIWRGIQIETGYVFSNNAGDFIQFSTVATATYARLGNAPVATFLASYGNRLVAAKDSILYWSGDRNYTEWSSAVDVSAGSSILADNSTDRFDNITGLIVVGSNLCIIRERSIWIVTLQASASNPFYAKPSVTGIGCDCPNTLIQVPDGFCFADTRTKKIYKATVQNGQITLEDISTTIFTTAIPATGAGYGSYDPITDEYWIHKSGRTCYVYAFKSKSWYQLEIEPLNPSGIAGGNIISIHNLSAQGISSRKWIGIGTTGNTYYGVDIGTNYNDDGSAFICSLTSKLYAAKSSAQNLELAFLSIFYRDLASGTLALKVYDGKSNVLRATKTVTLTATGNQAKITIRKVIKAKLLYWTLTWTPTSAVMLPIDEYAMKMHMIGNI